MKFTRSLDNTRLLTFASNKDARPQVKGPQDEASFLCDFISLNIYGNYTGRLDHAHWLCRTNRFLFRSSVVAVRPGWMTQTSRAVDQRIRKR